MCLALSPDGKTVAAGHGGGLVRLWDVASAKERDTCKGLGHLVFSLAYSPDGQTLAVSSYQQSVALLHPSNAARQGSIDVGNVYSLAYSPDGRTLALACDRVVKFWDVGTARERSALAVSDARCLAFAPDGKKLVTSSSWGNATVWGLPSGEKLHHWPFPHTASMQYHCSYVPVFAPDSRHLAVAGDTGKVYVFRLAPPATGRTE
jgi:WD40 repeat protein